MVAENISKSITGKLSLPEDNKNKSVLNVVLFIKKYLPELKNYKDVFKEDILTQKLVLILNRKTNLYIFQTQYIYENNGNESRVDIGTFLKEEEPIIIDTIKYSDDESFFSIEAKRLDSSLPAYRKEEYVIGRIEKDKYKDTGGIERFKKRIHGNDLKYAGLLGYVQSDNFDVWINKINNIIENQIITPNSSDIKWNNNDKLIEIYKDKNLREFKSDNIRNDSSFIKIFHLWIDLIE